MTSFFGKKVQIKIVGESHAERMSGEITGIPAGIKIDEAYIASQMARRAPGQDPTATSRKEPDKVEFVSGIINGVTNGEKIEIVIKNTNTRSGDYDNLKFTPRPSHADYPAFVKYKGEADMRGSGHFSGRLTSVLVALGAVCRLVLKEKGIEVGSHIYNIGESFDTAFNPVTVDASQLIELSGKYFPTISDEAKKTMEATILSAKKDSDSVGGCIEAAITGMPVGVGNHMFGGVENVLSALLYGIPAVKGVQFGAGFDFAFLRGTEANDPYYMDGDAVKTATNNCGGICGGMTTGMPIVFKVAFKPTPSVAAVQNTVNLQTRENVTLQISGRHDPCVVPRASAAVEAAAAIGAVMLLAEDNML